MVSCTSCRMPLLKISDIVRWLVGQEKKGSTDQVGNSKAYLSYLQKNRIRPVWAFQNQRDMLGENTSCKSLTKKSQTCKGRSRLEIPISNGVSIVGAIGWQASYNVRVHRGVVRVRTAIVCLLLFRTEVS